MRVPTDTEILRERDDQGVLSHSSQYFHMGCDQRRRVTLNQEGTGEVPGIQVTL